MAFRAGVEITDKQAIRAIDRLERNLPGAIGRGLLRFGLLIGRRIAENIEAFKVTPGTRRLSRSFLTPQLQTGRVASVLLGVGAPIYAAIHEFGGIIRAVHAPWLVFQTPDGEWHSVKEVHIREKRYARSALEDPHLTAQGGPLVAQMIVREFEG